MSTVSYPHIEISKDGHARIAGTGFKVRMLVEEHLAGVGVDELVREHPHLTLSQVYSALAFYHDHKQEMDQEIADLNRFAAEFFSRQEESVLAKKLRALGRDLP